MALVKITQERSKIRCIEKHKRTLVALGLRRINHAVIHEDTPQIRGMVDLVRYLVRVEPAGDAAPGTEPARRAKKKPASRKTKKRAAGRKKSPSAKKKAPSVRKGSRTKKRVPRS